MTTVQNILSLSPRTQKGSWLLWFLALFLPIILGITIGQAELVKSMELLPIVLPSCILGYFAGSFLGKSTFPSITAITYAFVYCLFSVAFLIGQTYDPEMIWRERIADMITQQWEWWSLLLDDANTSRPAPIFALHTSIFVWWISYLAGWGAMRASRVWRVILPAGIVVGNVVYNYQDNGYFTVYFALYCLVALVYLVQNYLEQNQREWKINRIAYDTLSITNAFLWTGLLVSMLAVAVSWLMPKMSSAEVVEEMWNNNQPWEEFQDEFQRMYGDVRGDGTAQTSSFASTMSFDGARNLGDAPVMDVEVDEPVQYPYWRNDVLDVYNGLNGWYKIPDAVFKYPSEESVLSVSNQFTRKRISQRITNYQDGSDMMFASPDVVAVDRPIWVHQVQLSNLETHITTIVPQFRLGDGDSYEVISLQSMATEADLRRSSINYPLAIREIYLTVPSSISPRTRELAQDITDGAITNYDKVIAVRDYLRTNITYNDQIAQPPSSFDPVDYVLFESQEGYCDYYASSMAMLLRTVGVPTRLARGYAAGNYEPHVSGQFGTYSVIQKDAHSWPEVYFEGFGWIPFEPTAYLSPIGRDSGESEDAPETTPTAIPTPTPTAVITPTVAPEATEVPTLPADTDDSSRFGGMFWVGIALLVGAGGTILFAFLRNNQEAELDSAYTYSLLGKWAKRLGLPVSVANTPYEQATMMSSAVPEGERPIREITDAYVETQYSREKRPLRTYRLEEAWNTLLPLLRKIGKSRK